MSVTSIHKYAVDLNSDTVRDTLRTPLGLSNAQAQTFALEVTEGGKAATLTGASCIGYFIRADGYTVAIDGSVSGNIALVTLPAACYAVPGRCKLSVNVSLSGAVHTLLMVEGYVDRTQTDAVVDTSNLIPSLDELLAQISAMEAATASANTATSNANTATSKANTAAASANTAADRANTAAAAAEDIADLTATATTLAAGSDATASYADGVLTIGVPKGEKGDKGDKGDTGPSSTSVNTIAPVDGNVTLTAADITMTATDTTTVAAAVSKRDRVVNLLDNSDFSNPINQRGITSTSAAGYHIDRWEKVNAIGTVTVGDGYLSMTGDGAYWFLTQYIPVEKIKSGRTYTIALADTDGNISVCSTTFSEGMAAVAAIYYRFPNGVVVATNVAYETDKYSLYFTSNSTTEMKFAWAALYEGSYTADTLPAYQPKGYAAELAECQRYYQQWYRVFGTDVGNVSREVLQLTPQMRIAPTTSIVSLWQGVTNAAATINTTNAENVDVSYTGWGNATIALSADL